MDVMSAVHKFKINYPIKQINNLLLIDGVRTFSGLVWVGES
jgi:hypothetical protein